jgi:hypothetical protein
MIIKVQCSHIVTFINVLGHLLMERSTNKLTIFDIGHSNILDVRSFRAADCDTDHYPVVAEVREGLAVSKQTTHRFRMEKFSLS